MSYLDSLTRNGDIYVITSVEEFVGLSDYVNSGNTCKELTFKLKNDLDFTKVVDFIGIGLEYRFDGTFDGDNHTISNLTLKFRGLFAGNYGIIKNLKIENVNVKGKYNSDRGYVENNGGIAGENRGKIINCYVSGNLYGSWSVGGIVGANFGEIINCKANVFLEVSKRNAGGVGGIVGHNKSKIIDCYAVVNYISGKEALGGIVGFNPRKKGYADGYFYSEHNIEGVGKGFGEDNTDRLYKISLPNEVQTISTDSIEINSEIFYKNSSTLTLSGSMKENDEIIISGSCSNFTLDCKIATIDNFTIKIDCSLPVDSYEWTGIKNNSATYKKIHHELKADGKKILCIKVEIKLFTISGINSTAEINIAENIVIVPKNNQISIVKIDNEDYELATSNENLISEVKETTNSNEKLTSDAKITNHDIKKIISDLEETVKELRKQIRPFRRQILKLRKQIDDLKSTLK